MKIIFDARPEKMYPLGKEGFSGGSQVYIRAITKGLAANGHQVHVIVNDLETDEQRGDNLFYWPPSYFPHEADVAVMQMHAVDNPEYKAPIAVLMTSCIDPYLGPNHDFAKDFDAIPVFSEVHKKLLCEMRPVDPDKCYVTGLGVELLDYPPMLYSTKVSGRMLYANDPARGLFYVLDVFDLVKKQVPEATLHVAYNFDLQLSWRQWEHSHMAEMLLDCKRRLDCTPGVVKLGDIPRSEVIKEQLECQVHCMPSDPPGRGTQTHGITQLECAAAGSALVLSDIEAFPEVFGDASTILPVIGQYLPEQERRVDALDYAAIVVELMQDANKCQEAGRKARALAEKNTWQHVINRWEDMLAKCAEKVLVHV